MYFKYILHLLPNFSTINGCKVTSAWVDFIFLGGGYLISNICRQSFEILFKVQKYIQYLIIKSLQKRLRFNDVLEQNPELLFTQNLLNPGLKMWKTEQFAVWVWGSFPLNVFMGSELFASSVWSVCLRVLNGRLFLVRLFHSSGVCALNNLPEVLTKCLLSAGTLKMYFFLDYV